MVIISWKLCVSTVGRKRKREMRTFILLKDELPFFSEWRHWKENEWKKKRIRDNMIKTLISFFRSLFFFFFYLYSTSFFTFYFYHFFSSYGLSLLLPQTYFKSQSHDFLSCRFLNAGGCTDYTSFSFSQTDKSIYIYIYICTPHIYIYIYIYMYVYATIGVNKAVNP